MWLSKRRIVHALTYEVILLLIIALALSFIFELPLELTGGLMLATIPMVAYALQISLWQAIMLDFVLTLCILVYTFIFQWIYDHIEARFFGTQYSH